MGRQQIATIKVNHQRMEELARPRMTFDDYNAINGPFPRLNANNQDTVWPVRKQALKYTVTERVKHLAQPHMRETQNVAFNKNGYPRSYFEASSAAKKAIPSERLVELAEPSERYVTQPDNSWAYDMIGRVQPSALKYKATERLKDLALPRDTRTNWLYAQGLLNLSECLPPECPKDTYSPAHDALLAKPRRIYEKCFDFDTFNATRIKNATKHVTSPAEHRMAIPFRRKVGRYTRPPWEVYKVPKRALKHKTTAADKRLSTIPEARNLRTTEQEREYNPDAFIITAAALKGRFPPRVLAISGPLQRPPFVC